MASLLACLIILAVGFCLGWYKGKADGYSKSFDQVNKVITRIERLYGREDE